MDYREMRRCDRQLDEGESIRILNETFWGLLSLSDELNHPYGVILSHALKDNKLYFHSSNEGYKIDLINNNPKCCYVVTLNPELIVKEGTVKYESVCAFGNIKIAEGREKADGYIVFNDRYLSDEPELIKKLMKNGFKKSHILIMTIEHMTAKYND